MPFRPRTNIKDRDSFGFSSRRIPNEVRSPLSLGSQRNPGINKHEVLPRLTKCFLVIMDVKVLNTFATEMHVWLTEIQRNLLFYCCHHRTFFSTTWR
jgi:hypothetical protein